MNKKAQLRSAQKNCGMDMENFSPLVQIAKKADANTKKKSKIGINILLDLKSFEKFIKYLPLQLFIISNIIILYIIHPQYAIVKRGNKKTA